MPCADCGRRRTRARSRRPRQRRPAHEHRLVGKGGSSAPAALAALSIWRSPGAVPRRGRAAAAPCTRTGCRARLCRRRRAGTRGCGRRLLLADLASDEIERPPMPQRGLEVVHARAPERDAWRPTSQTTLVPSVQAFDGWNTGRVDLEPAHIGVDAASGKDAPRVLRTRHSNAAGAHPGAGRGSNTTGRSMKMACSDVIMKSCIIVGPGTVIASLLTS